MTLERFWAIIEQIRARHQQDLDMMYELLYRELECLDTEELARWSLILEEYYRVYREQRLHEIVVKECGAEAADELCGWLLMQGREECDRVLGQPGLLRDILDQHDAAFGDIMGIAANVYLKRSGVLGWRPELFRRVQVKYGITEELLMEIRNAVAAAAGQTGGGNGGKEG